MGERLSRGIYEFCAAAHAGVPGWLGRPDGEFRNRLGASSLGTPTGGGTPPQLAGGTPAIRGSIAPNRTKSDQIAPLKKERILIVPPKWVGLSNGAHPQRFLRNEFRTPVWPVRVGWRWGVLFHRSSRRARRSEGRRDRAGWIESRSARLRPVSCSGYVAGVAGV